MNDATPAKQIFSFIMCVVSISLNGCNVLRMYEHVTIHPDDWLVYGGNIQHTNVSPFEIRPPLVQVWEYDAGAGFGSSSVVVTDSLIFIGTLQGELHVVRIGSGKRVGAIDIGSAIVGTPLVHGEVVYVPLTTNGENLIAFNLLRGTPDWRAKVGDIESSPLLIGNKIFAATLQGALLCVDRGDGSVVWEFDILSRGKPIRSSPAADDAALYFGADDGRLYAVGMREGKLWWTFGTRGSIVATPSLSDHRVYFGSTDGYFYCLEAASGSLRWKRSLGSRIYGSQAVERDRVFVGTADGTVYCLDARTGTTRWTFRAKSVVSAAPLVSGGVVFVGSLDKTLYALDAEGGQLLWNRAFSSRIKTSPVLWRGFLVLLLEDHTVAVFTSQGGKPL